MLKNLTMNPNKYIISDLGKNPQYFNEVISLIESEFHYSSEYKFEIDFAPLISPYNFEHCLIIIDKEKNQLAAHLAFTKRKLIKGKEELPVVFIGGIVTKKEYRGDNLFRSLINHCFSINTQAALFLLWSDIGNLYEKFGFHLSGAVIETGKNVITKQIENFEKTNFNKLSSKDFKRIQEIYHNKIEKNYFTAKRENIQWEIIHEMSSIDLFIERDSNNDIINYFCYGKGRDLICTIHESTLLDIEQIKKLSHLKLWLPENYKEQLTNFEISYLGFIKLGNIEVLNNFLKKISSYELSVSKLDDQIKANLNGADYFLTEQNFLHSLFGPEPAEEFKKYQLYLYIAGTDSV